MLLRVGSFVAPFAPRIVVPLARRRLRQLVGHLVVDAHDPALAEHLDRARARRLPAQPEPARRGGPRRGARPPAALARTTALLERDRRRLRLGQGVRPRLPDLDVGHRGHRRSGARAAATAVPGGDDEAPARVRQPRHGGVPRPRPDGARSSRRCSPSPSSTASRRGSCSRRTCRTPWLRSTSDRVRRGAGRGGWRRHQGPTRQGRQPVDGAGRRRAARVGRRRPTAARPRSTPTTCASSTGRSAPSSPACCASASPSTTCTTSPLAHLLAERRGVSAALDVEMLQGMSPAQARAVKAAVGTVLLYTPVVAPEDFDVAVAYLVRRLEENAAAAELPVRAVRQQGTASGESNGGAGTMADQEARFRASVAAMATTSQHPKRTRDVDRRRDRRLRQHHRHRSGPAAGAAWAAARVAAVAPALSSPLLASIGDVDRWSRGPRRAA